MLSTIRYIEPSMYREVMTRYWTISLKIAMVLLGGDAPIAIEERRSNTAAPNPADATPIVAIRHRLHSIIVGNCMCQPRKCINPYMIGMPVMTI